MKAPLFTRGEGTLINGTVVGFNEEALGFGYISRLGAAPVEMMILWWSIAFKSIWLGDSPPVKFG